MNQQTQIAGLASVQEKVRERIQATFAELIPQELWEGLVRAELEAMTKKLIPELVQQMARERLANIVRAEFSKPEWQGKWDYSGSGQYRTLGSEMVTEIVKAAAPEFVAALMGGLVQTMVQDLRSRNF